MWTKEIRRKKKCIKNIKFLKFSVLDLNILAFLNPNFKQI